jgi:DNA-binding response OmpR family regulator
MMRAHRFTLAEGDPNMLFLLHRMLARLYPKSHILMFSAAEDALAQILDSGTDVLITNHGVGKLSGTDLIRELRVRGYVIPIIMISGCAAGKREALAAGATRFLEKGAAPRVFEAHIRAMVEATDRAATGLDPKGEEEAGRPGVLSGGYSTRG